MAGGAVVILGVAAYLLISGMQSGAEFPKEQSAYVVDLETKEEKVLDYGAGETAPFVNEATGRRTFYPIWWCSDCERRFVPQASVGADGVPRIPAMPSCPVCNQMHTGQWAPEWPEQANPKNPDAPLPKLPA